MQRAHLTAIYSRTNPAHAWRFMRTASPEMAQLVAGVAMADDAQVEFLLLPFDRARILPEWIDASQPGTPAGAIATQLVC